jgi:ankyrin repeat protein
MPSHALSAYIAVLLQRGTTSLMWATAKGHLEAVKVLLDCKATVGAIDNNVSAVSSGLLVRHLVLVTLGLRTHALRHAPQSSARRLQGGTAMHYAAGHGRGAVAKVLAEAGIDGTIRDFVRVGI